MDMYGIHDNSGRDLQPNDTQMVVKEETFITVLHFRDFVDGEQGLFFLHLGVPLSVWHHALDI